MSEPKLLVDKRHGVLTLTLNRPNKLNAIDNEMCEALLNALEVGSLDALVRVIRLRGNGRSFCAGRDVSAEPTDKDLALVQAVAKAIVGSPKPVVVAVHGWTVGAGLEIMLDADIVIAAESSRFKFPEASLGVFVTGGLTATLPAAVGRARAKALVMLGEEFNAREALSWGMIYKVTLDNDLDEQSYSTSLKLANLNQDLLADFKQVFNTIGMERFDLAIDEENKAQRRVRG